MNIDIIGAGSLGMLFAGKLAAAGHGIRLWCRTAGQESALRERGLTITAAGGGETHIPGTAFAAGQAENFPSFYSKERSDWILLAVKQNALHTELPAVLGPLAPLSPRLLCLQNGSGHMEMLRALLPEAGLYAAVTTEAAKYTDYAQIMHTGSGSTGIGAWPGNARMEEAKADAAALAKILESAGFAVHVSNEVTTLLYRKLLINAVINPLTAIWRVTNGELTATAARLAVMEALYRETVTVYADNGISCGPGMWDTVLQVCRDTSANISSMLADVQAGRTTEIRWINGAVAEMAARSGSDATWNKLVCSLVEGMNAKER